MKNRKNNTHRGLTPFGHCLQTALAVIGFVSFFCMLGFTGTCELELITGTEYLCRAVPCTIVFCGCAYLYVKIFHE